MLTGDYLLNGKEFYVYEMCSLTLIELLLSLQPHLLFPRCGLGQTNLKLALAFVGT